ncbi:hypothetical protein V8E36_007907 [Tilletia maclaganii]
MDGFSFSHHASPAHHHHHQQQHHHPQQAHHHQQAHQHQHAAHAHHDPAAAAAALSTGAHAHTHSHGHQPHQHAAASTPAAAAHHASHAAAYGLGGSSLEELVAARAQLTDAVNRLSQAHRAAYEAQEHFRVVMQRSNTNNLAAFFSTNSPYVGEFSMTSFFADHSAGAGLGSIQSGLVGNNPPANQAAIQTSYASLAQGNNGTPQGATGQSTVGAGTSSGSAAQGANSGSGSAAAGVAGDKKGRRSKKDKKERDPNAPKRPPSAYILYQNDVRDSTRREMPDISYTGVLGKISNMWKGLSEEERNAYTEKRKRLMAEYTVIKKQYHARVAAQGGVVKDDSESEEEEEEEPVPQSINPAAFSTNDNVARHFTGPIAMNGLTSPGSVDPAALKKRKMLPAKEPAVGKRTKH